MLHPRGTESVPRYPALTTSKPGGEAVAKRGTLRHAAHGFMARRRSPGDPPPRKIISASLLHIAGGYVQYSWLSSVRVAPRAWRQLGSHEHFDSMVVRFTLDAKACDFRYGHPSSRKPYTQLGHVNRRQPGCDKRASVRRSL